MKRQYLPLVSAILVSSALGTAPISAKQMYPVMKNNETITVDANLDEGVWQQATQIKLLYDINPGLNTKAPVETTAYIYESESSLFIGFIAKDPNPEKIRAYYRDRDTIFQDDFVGIVIDTFNDNRRGYEFFVNPFGVQGDLIKDDTQGGNEDANWDAIWNSAGRITEDGYIVEMEIPFSVMRFPADLDQMNWGFQLLRIYPRDKRTVISNSAIDRDIDCGICQYDLLTGISKKDQGKNLQITPTVTYSYSEERPEINGPWNEADKKADAGVNARWGVNDNLYLNATLNPDFSQVEADAAQLDINNTFALFVNEKRPFFLDGSDYFNTQRMNLLHTRNINAPDYGLKLTGKTNRHTYGFLTANDESTTFLVPGTQGSSVAQIQQKSKIMVGRYRLDVGETSNVGLMVTDRRGDNYSNTVTSIDGKNTITKSDTISYQVAHSSSDNPDSIQQEYDVDKKQTDAAYSLRYSHNTQNYGFSASHMKYGENFRADLGFESQTGIKKSIVGGYYDWRRGSSNNWSRIGVSGDWDKTYDHTGQMLEEEAEVYFNADGPKQLFAELGLLTRESYWEGQYYDVNNVMTFFRFDPFDNLRVWNFIRVGDQIDYANNRLGDGTIVELGGNFKLGRHLNGEVNYNHRKVDVNDQNVFSANQYDVRLNYQFNLQSYLRFIVQYTDIERNPEMYLYESVDRRFKGVKTELLYAYKLNPQSLVYVGYTDRAKQTDELEDIEKDSRKVFMKLSYAFHL